MKARRKDEEKAKEEAINNCPHHTGWGRQSSPPKIAYRHHRQNLKKKTYCTAFLCVISLSADSVYSSVHTEGKFLFKILAVCLPARLSTLISSVRGPILLFTFFIFMLVNKNCFVLVLTSLAEEDKENGDEEELKAYKNSIRALVEEG